jgi:mycothiol system anti-sigma-R factor
MTCSKKAERLLHALLDGELDAMNAVDFETHLTTCAACAAEFEHQQEMRAAIRQIGATEKAPQRLRLKIEAMIDEAAKPAAPPTAPRAPASGWRAKGLSLAIAACLALAILLPGLPPTGGDEIREQLVASHVRSLLAEHLTDIQSSDRHTVRPWFNGKVDVAPPTVDLAKEGFPCLGGRLDYIENQVVAVLVYKRGSHVINLFVRSAPDEQDLGPRDSMFRGYNLRQWRRDGMEFWAVTDASEPELDIFQAAYTRANESNQ